MTEPMLDSWDTRPESVRALANQYADRHKEIVNFTTVYFIPFHLLRRLGIQFRSTQGYLASGLFHLLLVLLPALIFTAITGQWASAPLVRWIIVAAGWAVLLGAGYPLWQAGANDIVSLHRALADKEVTHKLMAWDRRWFNVRVTALVSSTLALGAVVFLYVATRHGSGAPPLAGTVWIGAAIVFTVGDNIYIHFMVAVEACMMSTCRYQLYGLSPIDSLAIQWAVRGYNQGGVLSILLMTLIILAFVILLPAGSNLLAPLVVSLLLLEYLSVALGTLVPRLMIGRIVRAKKEEEMKPLRHRLNSLLPRLEELTEEQYEGMKRLQETHDTIRDSPGSLLPLGEIAKVVGALLLSTITVLVTAFAQEWIGGLVKSLQP